MPSPGTHYDTPQGTQVALTSGVNSRVTFPRAVNFVKLTNLGTAVLTLRWLPSSGTSDTAAAIPAAAGSPTANDSGIVVLQSNQSQIVQASSPLVYWNFKGDQTATLVVEGGVGG